LTDEHQPGADQPQAEPAPQAPAPPPAPIPNAVPEHHESAGAGSTPRSDERKKSLGELWADLETSEKITAGLSVATVLVAIGSLVTAIASLSTSVDNKQMANAIGHLTDIVSAQQDEVKGIANETAALDNEANATGRVAVQTTREAIAATNTAGAAQGQLSIMKSESASQVIISDVVDTQPLSADKFGEMLFPKFKIDNIGHSIARYTTIIADFYTNVDNKVVERQTRVCDQFRHHRKREGFTVAQGGSMPMTQWLHMTPEDLAKWKRGYPIHAAPMLVGCASWYDGPELRQYPFVYEVDRRDPAGRVQSLAIDPNGGDVPAGDVLFSIPPWFAPQ
jgi:hypothetical protein